MCMFTRKVHGVGRLTSPNGDVYQGAFKANKFHGLGRFTKGNGDTYLGQCSEGRAEGWGVLCQNTDREVIITRTGEVWKCKS